MERISKADLNRIRVTVHPPERIADWPRSEFVRAPHDERSEALLVQTLEQIATTTIQDYVRTLVGVINTSLGNFSIHSTTSDADVRLSQGEYS